MSVGSVLARATVVIGGDVTGLDNALGIAQRRMMQVGDRMTDIGKSISLKVTLPLALSAAGAVSFATDFDTSMRKTAALTSLPLETVNSLRESVRAMGMEFGASGKDAAEALFFIATPSLDAAQTMDVLRQSLKATSIGLGETKSIAMGAVGAMNAYASSGLTATRAIDIMAAGVKHGRFETEELVPVLGSLTGISSAMGISFENVIGTLSVMTLTGSSTAEAATQLSSIMSTLMGTSEEGEKLLDKFHLSLAKLRDIAAGPGGLIAVFRTLDEATGGNIEQLEALFPNIRALRGVMIALAQDADVVDSAMRGVKESTGFLNRAFALFAEGPAFQLKTAFAQVKDALISVGNVLIPILMPAITAAAKVVKGLASAFEDLPPWIKNTIAAFVILIAAFGPMLVGLGLMIKILSISGIVGLLIKALKVLITTFPAAGAAARLLGSGMGYLVTVGGLVIAAIAAVTMAGIQIVLHWTWLKQQTLALWTMIADYIFMSVDFILGALEKIPFVGKKLFGAMREEFQKFWEESLAFSGRSLAELENELMGIGEVVGKVTDTVKKVKPPPIIPPDWLAPATEAVKTFNASIKAAAQLEELFGDQFDETAAKAAALETVVTALTDAGVPFNANLVGTTATLATYGQRLSWIRVVIDEAKKAQEAFDEQMGRAQAAVDAAITPQQIFNQTMKDLNAWLLEGADRWERYKAAVEHAKQVLADTKVKASELQRALQDLVKDGVSDFVDAVFDAKTNWHDFFHTMMQDIAKLIIKTIILSALMKSLKSGEGFMGGLGKIMGFAKGGFLAPGQVGLVGERGPELVMAGNQGMRITPMPAMRAASPQEAGGGAGMRVEVNVHAIDSRGVAQFFEENEGLVAGAMMRAGQRSSALRRRLG